MIALVAAAACAHRPDHFAQAENYLRAGQLQQATQSLDQAITEDCGRRNKLANCGAAHMRAGDIASRAGDVQRAITYFVPAMFSGEKKAKERLDLEKAKLRAQQGPMTSTLLVQMVNDVGPPLKMTKQLLWLDGEPMAAENVASGPHWITVLVEFDSASLLAGPFKAARLITYFFETSIGQTAVTVRTYLDPAKQEADQLSVSFRIVPLQADRSSKVP